jgi:hypothetical protein
LMPLVMWSSAPVEAALVLAFFGRYRSLRLGAPLVARRDLICAGHYGQRSCDVLKLRGDIEAGDYAKFRSYFGDQRRIAGLDLDSPGGSLYGGFRIATVTRQKRLLTFVSKECDSACAFVFLLGSKRYVSKEAKIGVHAVGNDHGARILVLSGTRFSSLGYLRNSEFPARSSERW